MSLYTAIVMTSVVLLCTAVIIPSIIAIRRMDKHD